MQRQGDLWRHIDEALAQQQPHRFAGVVEDLLELLRHAARRTLLTTIQEKLLHLLHALHTLPKRFEFHNKAQTSLVLTAASSSGEQIRKYGG